MPWGQGSVGGAALSRRYTPGGQVHRGLSDRVPVSGGLRMGMNGERKTYPVHPPGWLPGGALPSALSWDITRAQPVFPGRARPASSEGGSFRVSGHRSGAAKHRRTASGTLSLEVAAGPWRGAGTPACPSAMAVGDPDQESEPGPGLAEEPPTRRCPSSAPWSARRPPEARPDRRGRAGRR